MEITSKSLLQSTEGQGPIRDWFRRKKDDRKYKKLARQKGAKCKRDKNGHWVCNKW